MKLFTLFTLTVLPLTSFSKTESHLASQSNVIEICTETVVDHGGTIDASCYTKEFKTFGCYDVVETTCRDENDIELRKFREERMNGKCGNSYSDCW